jgi:hypothetical protein
MLRSTAGRRPWPWGRRSEAAFPWQRPTSDDERWPLPRRVMHCCLGHAEGVTDVTNVDPVSQAENASSILVARSRLGFVATID